MTLTGGFQLVLFLGHELEAGEGVVGLDPVGLSDHAGHVRCHQRLEGHSVGGQGPGPLFGADQIVQQQHARLVAGNLDVLAGLVLDLDGHAVGVGVRAEDEVGVDFFRQVQRQGEALRRLRVGGLDGGEGPVDDHLLRDAMQVPDAQLAQHIGDLLVPGAVEGGVDHGEGIRHLGDRGLVVDLRQDMGEELVVGLLAHQGDEALLQRRLIGQGLDVVKYVQLFHLGGDGGGVLGRQLGAVGPVDFIAVVLRGVVAGGDVQARSTAVLPHSEGQLRGGAHGLEQAHGDTVARHHFGGGTGELLGVDPAVVADGNALGSKCFALGQDDVGKGLGGVADDVDVHPAQADAHHAPQPGGAELEQGEEAVFDLACVVRKGGQLVLLRLGEGGAVQPAFILFLVGHHTNSFRVARHRFGVTGLFVVAGPGVDLKGPVNLLQDHHPRQVVGEGHGGHGEP